MTAARFEGTGPVARYWLANCEGFRVRGGLRGTVEELLRDADPHVTTRLVVRTRARRRAVVPVDAVALVVPAERTVVVERAQPRLTATAVPAARAGAAAAGVAGRHTAAAARRATGTAVPAARAGAAAAGAAGRHTAAAARRATAATALAARRATDAAAPPVERGAGRLRVTSRDILSALAASFGALVDETGGTARLVARSARRK